jgi:predicted dinucleotide-binding enzyme
LAAGHSIALSNSRGPDTLQALIEDVGFAPLALGLLRDSHRMEPGRPIYNEPLPRPEIQALLKGITV